MTYDRNAVRGEIHEAIAGGRHRRHRVAHNLLQGDVVDMLKEARRTGVSDPDLAHDLIVVIRERVLQELQSYARQNIR